RAPGGPRSAGGSAASSRRPSSPGASSVLFQSSRPAMEAPMDRSETPRVDALERRVHRLEGELEDLRVFVLSNPAPAAATAPTWATPAPAPQAIAWEPEPPRPEPPRPVEAQRPPRFTFDPASLFGARALAVTG